MHIFLCFCEQEVIFFCVREEPVVFLHKDDDFVPYTPRRKENLHENLHGLEKEELVESLELTVRKEVTNAHLLGICVRQSRAFWHIVIALKHSRLPPAAAPRLCQAERKRLLRLQRHRVLQRRAAEDLYHV